MGRVDEQDVLRSELLIERRLYVLDRLADQGEPAAVGLGDDPEHALGEGLYAGDLQSGQPLVGVRLVEDDRRGVAGAHLKQPGGPQVGQHRPVDRGVRGTVEAVARGEARPRERLSQHGLQPRRERKLAFLGQVHAGRPGPSHGPVEVGVRGEGRVEMAGGNVGRFGGYRSYRAGRPDRTVDQRLGQGISFMGRVRRNPASRHQSLG